MRKHARKSGAGTASGTPVVDPQQAAQYADIVRFLSSGHAFGPQAPVRRIDTHAATIFLSGERAWKIKQPVALGYLDFSTAARRRDALDAELSLNRRTASDVYLAVHPITRAPDGALGIGGKGVTIDWVLEMRRFADGALLEECAERGALDDTLMMTLAQRIQTFHSSARIVCLPAAVRMREVITGNAQRFAALAQHLDPNRAAAIVSAQRERLELLAPLLDRRARAGRVRHCHGDLHLANIAMIDGTPVPFDCLEFDAELATIDVLYDLAFLLMDLWHRDLPGLASRLFNHYLDLSAEDEQGIALMPLFLSLRASVRAHVSAERARRTRRGADAALAHDYLALAEALLEPVPPRLIAIGGRSGTGKSMLARWLAPRIGGAPGARVLRSDVLRKRLAGVTLDTRLPPDHYTAETARAVYGHLGTMALDALCAGVSVIADAAFLTLAERRAIAGPARDLAVPFTGLWLETGEQIRRARVAQRAGDVSDANPAVVRLQSRRRIGSLENWHRVRAGRPPHEVAAVAARLLRCRQ